MGSRNRNANIIYFPTVERLSPMPDVEQSIEDMRPIGDIKGLLDKGVDIYAWAVGDSYGAALVTAILAPLSLDQKLCWCTALVQLMLQRGAYINAVASDYGTALAAAAFRGNEHIISLLLYRDADINMVGGKYGTALAAAAFQGHTDIALLLLERGAEINMVGGEYGTALGAAAYGGQVHMVLLLLDRGAEVNRVGGKYGTALLAAAANRSYYQSDIVTQLLDKGADITAIGGEYETVLATAAFYGHTTTVSLLLDKGAKYYINKVGGKCETALGAAVLAQSKDMVSLLLNHGADMTLVTGELGTVLGQAIHHGSTAMVSLLLEHGADIIHVGGSYSTASGMYPSALDAAHSEGSKAGPDLLALLETAIGEQNGQQIDIDPVENIISRPPFPMPYSQPYSALSGGRNRGTDTLSTKLRAGDNITSQQSDVRCHELSEDILRHSLTALVGLNEDAIKAKSQWIQNDIRYFVARNFDFGLAYAAARVAWKHFNTPSVDSRAISIQRGNWHTEAQLLDKERLNAIAEDDNRRSTLKLIRLPYLIMPRRIWDLKSNRVVDFRMLLAAQPNIKDPPPFWAVSHSWTDNMSRVRTSINQQQWRVPLPQDITLDNLRTELLRLGAEYIWIDVLCLRQRSEDDELEQLRLEEWKVDVPTIGNVYRKAKNIVRYFNGLGIPFSNEGWNDRRHWLQRAWTLQEIATENTTLNGGTPQDAGHVFMNRREKVSGIKLRLAIRPILQLAAQVSRPGGCELYELAREMSRRYASKEIDKISGLFYLLRTTKLPCYDEKMTEEAFWKECIQLLPVERKLELLFDFPYRGSDAQWFPTWAQVLDWPVRDPDCDHLHDPDSDLMRSREKAIVLENVSRETEFFVQNIWATPDARLHKTATAGEYKVEITGGLSSYYFYLPYLSQKEIDIQDDTVFVLVTENPIYSHNWVVCSRVESRWTMALWDGAPRWDMKDTTVLKKVGVIRTDSCSELLVGEMLQKMDCIFV